MPELSLNVLDIAQNSVKARASLIGITVEADTAKDLLTIIIEDNGCGMTEEQIDTFTDSTLGNQQRLLANNYVSLDRSEIHEIFAKLR